MTEVSISSEGKIIFGEPQNKPQPSTTGGILSDQEKQIIESPSWGATLGFFYLIGMEAWSWFAIFIAASVVSSFLLGLPLIVLAIYLVYKGKSIAWKSRTWKDFNQFLTVQRMWDRWGKVLLVVQLIILAIAGVIMANIILKYYK